MIIRYIMQTGPLFSVDIYYQTVPLDQYLYSVLTNNSRLFLQINICIQCGQILLDCSFRSISVFSVDKYYQAVPLDQYLYSVWTNIIRLFLQINICIQCGQITSLTSLGGGEGAPVQCTTMQQGQDPQFLNRFYRDREIRAG